MRAPQRAETKFKWRDSPASSFYAGTIVAVPNNPDASSIQLFGTAFPSELYQIGENGKVFTSTGGILSSDIATIKNKVEALAGMRIENVTAAVPPVEPGQTISDFGSYVDLT